MGYILKNTTGQNVREISDELGIPIVVVDRVIRSYLKKLEDAGLAGNSININGLVSVTPLIDVENDEVTTRSRVSEAFKTKLRGSEHVKKVVRKDMEYINALDKPKKVDMNFLQTID